MELLDIERGKSGLLPDLPPLIDPPQGFEMLEQFNAEMPTFLEKGTFRSTIKHHFPVLYIGGITDKRELEYIDRVSKFLAAGYIYERWQTNPSPVLHCNLAQLICATSKKLGIMPILSYHQYATTNWRVINDMFPPYINNVQLLSQFTRCKSEWGFIAPHIQIEFQFKCLTDNMTLVQYARDQGDVPRLIQRLNNIARGMREVVQTLKDIPKICDPKEYYTQVRPWIMGYKNHPVVYASVAELRGEPQRFRGETGAQSVGMPCLDALLGVEHDLRDPLSIHLMEMRAYRTPEERELLIKIEMEKPLRPFVVKHASNGELVDAFNACVQEAISFREPHKRHAETHIAEQTQIGTHNTTTVGTGGTNYGPSLMKHIEDTRRCLIRKTA